jgi:hypothetical protein
MYEGEWGLGLMYLPDRISCELIPLYMINPLPERHSGFCHFFPARYPAITEIIISKPNLKLKLQSSREGRDGLLRCVEVQTPCSSQDDT